MPIVQPFKAVRPAREYVHRVTTRSYEAYPDEERENLLASNPLSFLHIIRPGYAEGRKMKPKKRYRNIRKRYEEFLSNGILLREDQPSLYVYEIQKGGDRFLGFFGAAHAGDYHGNRIKKHEETLEQREALFARYLEAVQFNAEPVLLMYPDQPEVTDLLTHTASGPPEYNFGSPDGYHHRMWLLNDPDQLQQLQGIFHRMEALYIADGHHRSASSGRLAQMAREANPQHRGTENYNSFMSFFLAESQIKISGFSRMIRDLNGHSPASFLRKLKQEFILTEPQSPLWVPDHKHEICMYLNGSFYSLKPKGPLLQTTDPLSRLDTQVLYSKILNPILGIKDLRNDERITYRSGKEQWKFIKMQIDAGLFAVGFNLLPVTVKEVKEIADAGLVMPPKSTYIEPKLRSGLTIYEL